MSKKENVKITVSGYYGFGNTGDEAILTSLLSLLKRIPKVQITVLSAYPKRTRREHGVRSVSRINPVSVFHSLLKCDILISGGGGLLQDVTSSRSLLYYLSIIYLGVCFKKKVVLLAQSIGPISKALNRKLTSRVLNKVTLITVRDEHSFRELDKLGVRGAPIYQTADLALLLEKPKEEDSKKILEFLNLKGPFVVFCLRSLKHRRIRVKDFAEIAKRLKNELQVEIVFLPFQFSLDQELSEQLSALVPGSILCPFLKPRQIISLFAKAELVVGMRLHAIIFSALARTPFLPVSYDPKVSSFAQLLNQEALSLEEDAEKIFLKIEENLKNRAKIKESLEKGVLNLEQKAEENWKHLKKIINTFP
ncbi:MAG: polysaccharide pyruvyl transferase CsaB [bacterium]